MFEAATDLDGLGMLEVGVALPPRSDIGRETVVVVRLKLSVQHRIPG